MSSDDLIIDRVQSSFRQLTEAAADLNKVSDDLGACVADLDSALKKLNLGITTWTTIRHDEDVDGRYWGEDIGYATAGKWGITLRTFSGHQNLDEDDIEAWLFNDAPRSLRLSAIEKIPELLEKLSKEASESTKQIVGKLHQARAVADAIKQTVEDGEEPPPRSSVPHRRVIRQVSQETRK